MELKILGSVSPYPAQDKNCVGYLVISGKTKVLLDCGNGSLKNLNLPEDLNNLTVIISHYHKDHYADLLSLAYASYVFHKLGYLKDKINVYIPKPDTYYGSESYTDNDGWSTSRTVEQKIIDYEYLTSIKEQYLNFITYDENKKIQLDDLSISFSKTNHSINTYAASLKDNDSNLVYSSDTGFIGNGLVKFAKNADLLLCESTFIRGQNKTEDNHLFAYEAGMIAKEAEVDKLVLTHFWPSIDPNLYVKEAQEEFINTEAAIDNKVFILRKDM